MNTKKKTGVTFYLYIGALAFAIAGLILYLVTNQTPGYAVISGSMGLLTGMIAVALIALCAFATVKFGPQHIVTSALGLVSLALLMVSFGVLLSDRAVLASALFTWNSHNTLGWSVFYTSVAGGVLMLLSVILLIVNGFLDAKKK